jgi:hypothetical protein
LIKLLGSPDVELRPDPFAQDQIGQVARQLGTSAADSPAARPPIGANSSQDDCGVF